MRSLNARPGSPWTWRRAAMPSLLGLTLCGCAAMTKDVDAYYRQMAINYKEALDDARLEEKSLEKKSRVYAVTKDEKQYRKTQRELDRVRTWEERCAREQERFAKAAKWMESHFDLNRKGNPESAEPADASPGAHQADGEGIGGGDVKGTPAE